MGTNGNTLGTDPNKQKIPPPPPKNTSLKMGNFKLGFYITAPNRYPQFIMGLRVLGGTYWGQ